MVSSRVDLVDGRPIFRRYSEENAQAVRQALACGCRPYLDVFTFNLWRRMGYMVKRGEHGIHLGVLIEKDIEDRETRERRTIRVRGGTVVFCRHQVEERQ